MRTCKTGLDYFSLDVDFFSDEKIEFVSAKYGELGELTTIKLLCRIYRNGYFLPWDEDACILFAKKAGENINIDLINNVIEELFERDFLSEELFKKYQILTSRGIQKRFFESTKRRSSVDVYNEFLIVNIKRENVTIIPLNTYIGTQRKGKERKGKETLNPKGLHFGKSNNYPKRAREVLEFLNEQTGKNFSDTKLIIPRLREGKTVEQCKQIIINKSQDPFFIENPEHLNPETLFRPKHWDKYLNYIPPRAIKSEGYDPRENPNICRDCKQPASSIWNGLCPKCRGE